MHRLAKFDHSFIWHPFTQMRDWLKGETIVIKSGKGAVLRDVKGRKYLDANSSIWTNLHGHNHPKINAAINRQLKKIAHSSALGFANEPASLLGEQLVQVANIMPETAASSPSPPRSGGEGRGEVAPRAHGETSFDVRCSMFDVRCSQVHWDPSPRLSKVFYSDDGSTAMEVALKLAYQFVRRTGRKNPKFLSLGGAYHGDTVGAVSLGHIDLFHKAYSGLLFKSDEIAAPYCYRCPFNRAKPERADAREYRKCNWECVGKLEQKFVTQKKRGNPYAAFVFEPLMQGAAGMIPQPKGWLRHAAGIARAHGALLVADEVMTGFGRTNSQSKIKNQKSKIPLFACHEENIHPDFLALAKGLTGGYLPMAATLTTQKVFDAFLGKYEDFKTFFHGHSYTGNQLGGSAALASLEILRSNKSVAARQTLANALRKELKMLWKLPNVGDVRQVGLVAGIELVRDWRTREPFDLRERAGIRVCDAMAKRGVLTRPVGNVIVLIPPYCTSPTQIHRMVKAIYESCNEIFG